MGGVCREGWELRLERSGGKLLLEGDIGVLRRERTLSLDLVDSCLNYDGYSRCTVLQVLCCMLCFVH